MTPHIVEQCRRCGSYDIEWRRDEDWLTGSVRRLQCSACGDVQRSTVGLATWVMFIIAAAAAVAGWIAVLA